MTWVSVPILKINKYKHIIYFKSFKTILYSNNKSNTLFSCVLYWINSAMINTYITFTYSQISKLSDNNSLNEKTIPENKF